MTKKISIPEFESDNELRDYLMQTTLELVVNLKNEALRKGNVRKAPITNSRMGIYRVALESIKVLNMILKDRQIDNIQATLKMLEGGFVPPESNNENIFELTPELKEKMNEFENSLKELSEV